MSVAKRGLVFAASRGENVTRNINAVEEKVAHNPTTELRNINLQENSINNSVNGMGRHYLNNYFHSTVAFSPR